MKEKSRILEEITNIQLISDEDINEINKWGILKIKTFLKKLCHEFGSDDVKLCPWCIYYYELNIAGYTCSRCEYGKRHGKCPNDPKSTYHIILDELRSIGLNRDKGICGCYGVQTLLEYIRKCYKKISDSKFLYSDLFRKDVFL